MYLHLQQAGLTIQSLSGKRSWDPIVIVLLAKMFVCHIWQI